MGAGCTRSATRGTSGALTAIDADLHLYAATPKNWSHATFPTFEKSATSQSGLTKIAGAVTIGFGPRDSHGVITTKVHVIAIPKIQVSTYEAARMPEDARYVFDAGEYKIYISASRADDADVKNFLRTLRYQSQ